jgi:hypothetical protein
MGTHGTRVTEVRPSIDRQLAYSRLIERNGIAVSRYELDRQDAEYRARIARSAEDPAQSLQRRHNDNLLAKRRAEMMVEDVVNTLQFDLSRREYRHGVPMIVVSFAARPGASPVTREGRVARAFRGELWIEEASRELTDVKAVAVDDVSFGGFVARIYEGMEATVEREQIEPGVWMPTRLTLSGDVRALFRKARIDHVVEWFDYKRMPQ